MLYREIISGCSQIHTKHIKYSVWAEPTVFECDTWSHHWALEGLIFFHLRYSATEFKDKQFSCSALQKSVTNKVE